MNMKTKKDLLYALANRIGGEDGARLHEQLKVKTPFDDVLNRTMSDEDFATELKKLENDLPKAFVRALRVAIEQPGSWGLPN
jgi:hypothetical protein